MVKKFTNKVASLDVFENINNEIVIKDTAADWGAVAFDECLAEKLCRMIMKVAKKIREEQENG